MELSRQASPWPGVSFVTFKYVTPDGEAHVAQGYFDAAREEIMARQIEAREGAKRWPTSDCGKPPGGAE